MSRKSVSIDAQIASYCDKAIEEMPQYRSRADYVEQACIKQLETDKIIFGKQVTQKKKLVRMEEVSA